MPHFVTACKMSGQAVAHISESGCWRPACTRYPGDCSSWNHNVSISILKVISAVFCGNVKESASRDCHCGCFLSPHLHLKGTRTTALLIPTSFASAFTVACCGIRSARVASMCAAGSACITLIARPKRPGRTHTATLLVEHCSVEA